MTRLWAILRPWRTVIGGVLTVAVLLTLAMAVWPSGDVKKGTAYFSRAVHLYANSDVVVLGVKIGTVKKVTPEGEQVRIDFEYEADRKIPADVHAVIVVPTIVADRVLQLAPAYDGGAVLEDKATIPIERTGIPVELDEFNRNVTELALALGPDGANKDGSLSELVEVTADNLRGNGQAANDTITGLSGMVGTLSDNREQLFRTLRNLRALVRTLSEHDTETRAFSRELTEVSRFLAAQRDDFGLAVHTLGNALDDVAGFIRDNRDDLAKNVGSLTSIAELLRIERYTLAHTLDAGAVGVTNYPHMYSPVARTYNSRFVGNAISDNPALFICQLLDSVGVPPEQCLDILEPLDDIPLPKGMDRTLGGILPGAPK